MKHPTHSGNYAISAVRVADARKLRLVLGFTTDFDKVEDFLAHRPTEWTDFMVHVEYGSFEQAIRVVEGKAVLSAAAWV